MNKKNFLFIFSLVFSFFYIIKCAEPATNKCKFKYFYINDSFPIGSETDFELKKDTGIEEIKTFLSNCNYTIDSDKEKYQSINEEMTCRVLLISTDKNTNVESNETVDIKKKAKVDLSSKKCDSVRFYFFSNDVITKIEKCKVTNVNIFGQNITLTNPIEIKDYLHEISPSSLGNSIYKTLKTKNLTDNINLSEKQYGKNKTVTLDELFKTSCKDSYDNFYVKKGNDIYDFEKDENGNLCLDIPSLRFKRNITINFKIPENYILDVDCPNSFNLDLYLKDFSIKNIIIALRDSLKVYFNNLITTKKNPDSDFRETCDIEFLSYGFNEQTEPIDPKKYTLTNTGNDTKTINNNDDINSVDFFNLTDNSTIEIEVGERCELLKTMIAEIEFKPLEGTEVNSKIKKDTYKILLNLNDSSPENLKKQITDYLKSKKIEGYYIPEDFYEQILNKEGFLKGTHDHFELSINLNEKAKGTFLKPKGAPDPDLEYFKNYKEEDGKPIEPPQPQYIPPVQEQKDTPKLDEKTGNCAKCCGKCLKCSNCNKKDR